MLCQVQQFWNGKKQVARLRAQNKNTVWLENKCLHFIDVDTATWLFFYYNIQMLSNSTSTDCFDNAMIIKETSAVALR